MITADVVYKREKKWYLGSIKEGVLKKKRQVKKLSDVTNKNSYITFKKWCKESEEYCDTDIVEALNDLNVESLYVKNEPIETTKTKSFVMKPVSQKDWWSHYNKLCIRCAKKCKQSSHVDIITCNNSIK